MKQRIINALTERLGLTSIHEELKKQKKLAEAYAQKWNSRRETFFKTEAEMKAVIDGYKSLAKQFSIGVDYSGSRHDQSRAVIVHKVGKSNSVKFFSLRDGKEVVDFIQRTELAEPRVDAPFLFPIR